MDRRRRRSHLVILQYLWAHVGLPPSTEHTNSTLSPSCELGDTFCHISIISDLHDMASQSIWAILGYQNRRFCLVFGAGRPASGFAGADLNCSFFGFPSGVSVFILVSAPITFICRGRIIYMLPISFFGFCMQRVHACMQR